MSPPKSFPNLPNTSPARRWPWHMNFLSNFHLRGDLLLLAAPAAAAAVAAAAAAAIVIATDASAAAYRCRARVLECQSRASWGRAHVSLIRARFLIFCRVSRCLSLVAMLVAARVHVFLKDSKHFGTSKSIKFSGLAGRTV